MGALLKDLWQIPAVDQHAHNLLQPDAAARYPYPAAFTEGQDAEVIHLHARQTLFYRRSLRDVAALLGCEAVEEAILERRTSLGWDGLAEICFRAAGLEAVLLDDGFLPDESLPLEWHARFVPVQRVLRFEAQAEALLPESDRFDTFLDCFRAALDPPPHGVAAFKSIAAYRSGLDVWPAPREMAMAGFRAWRQAASEGQPRLTDKALIDFLLQQVFEIAARHEVPVQLHTGFGDPDLDLRLSNPLHLRPLLENVRFRRAPVVLLHASYPFAREAGYLASVYPQVFLDLGLAVPFLSVAGMRAVMAILLEIAPFSKLMYSSDAHYFPELFYLAAKWGRQILGEVLEAAVGDSDLTAQEADEAAALVLRGNARALYSRH